jgi:glycolate oxidase FAD binding subunit
MIATASILPLTETIAPADEAAVAAAVYKADRSRTPVYTVGGGTCLDYGVRPSRPGIGLTTTRLGRVLDYPADDLTISVQAGLTMAELTRRLSGHRQRLPIDVRCADQATVGGMVATNAGGPRRYAYGTIRDYVLGLRAVDGRGEVFAGGGRVVKNAAGYNTPRLLVGSLGTLGVITQVTLMVRPQPDATALLAADLPDFETAELALLAMGHTQTLPVAIELLAGAWPRFHPGLPAPLPGTVARLVVGFDGSKPEVHWMIQQVCKELQAADVESLTIANDEEQASVWWDSLAEFPATVLISVLPHAVVDVVEDLTRLVPHGAIQARAGNGLIYVQLDGDTPPAPREGRGTAKSEGRGTGKPGGAAQAGYCDFAALLREKLRPLAMAAGGKLVVLSHPDAVALTRDDIWGPPGDAAAVMQAVKKQFDPHGILNPDRFVFGV